MDTTGIVAIAVGATAVVFTAAEVIIFKAFGIGSDAYKNIINFSKKNKNISELKDVFKNIRESNDYISKKISYIEKAIENVPYNRINALDNEIKDIKLFLENQRDFFEKSKELEKEILYIKNEYKNSDSKIEKLNKYTSELNSKICNYSELFKKVENLEKIIIEKKGNEVLYSTSSGEDRYKDLIETMQNKFNSDIMTIKLMIKNNKANINTTEIDNIYKKIESIEDNVTKLGSYIKDMHAELNALSTKYEGIRQDISDLKYQNDKLVNQKIELHKNNDIDSDLKNNNVVLSDNNLETDSEVTTKNIIVPDEKYIKMLEDNFKQLENVIPKNLQAKFKKLISEIDEDDLDDSEELLNITNRVINDCIVKSFNKVKSESIPLLIQFIEKAGYKEINVKEGCLLKDYIKYFEPIFSENPEDSSLSGTIKSIILKPYMAYTQDLEEVILYGECIYYK